MKTALAILATAALAVGPLAAVSGADEEPNIVELAVAASTQETAGGTPDEEHGDFDLLISGVIAAELVDALTGKGQLTVFAPIDQAFLDLTDSETEDEALGKLAAMDRDLLRAVILYHVAPGARTADEVVPAQRIRTVTKQFIAKDSGGVTLYSNGDPSMIVGVDNIASNGVVHAIDGVLIP